MFYVYGWADVNGFSAADNYQEILV